MVFTGVKVLGAAYLIYLGLGMLHCSMPSTNLLSFATVSVSTVQGRDNSFFQSVLVEVLNPKTAIFFVAFLPQFVLAEGASWPIWLQMMILGMLANVICTSAELACITFAVAATVRLRHLENVEQLSKVFGGTILIALGGLLAFENTEL